MRNLPPLPDDVLTFQISGTVNDSDWAISHHLYCPGSIAYTASEFQQIVYGWGVYAEANLLDLMPGSASFTTCRLRRVGTSPYVHTQELAANAGAGGIAQSLNTALCLTWHTELAGVVSRSHTRLPLQASVVDNNKRAIDPSFISFAQLRADAYLLNLNSIVVGGFVSPQFVVVSRARGDAPLPTSGFAPVVAGDVSPRVATLRSRLL